jgi:metal-sulfur cluster biosynthetic enzyme
MTDTNLSTEATTDDDAVAAATTATTDGGATVGAATGTPASGTGTPPNVADVEEALRDVVDPELGINVVDLGLIYGITVDAQSHAVIDMTLTSAACPLTDVIEDQTAQALEGLVPTHRINWVWMPPWGPDKITDDGREQLRALGFNV